MKKGKTIYGDVTIFVEKVRVNSSEEFPLVDTLNSPEKFIGKSVAVWSNYTQRWVLVNHENILTYGLFEACRKPILMDEKMGRLSAEIMRSLIEEVK
jgi:hypothetical protein